MHQKLSVLFLPLAVCVCISSSAQEGAIGRWDLTFDLNGREGPGWLEIEQSGNQALVGRIMVLGGSARPIAEVKVAGNKMHFIIPPQWDSGKDFRFQFTLENDMLKGRMKDAKGRTRSWTGVRAPELKRDKDPAWGEPIPLFNGKDLSGWHHSGETKQWKAENGILVNPSSGSNLITDAKFDDFKLHLEFRYPKGSNSGVYLRGRYEVQISDDIGKLPNSHLLGGVYGMLEPNEMVAKAPGEWQVYDITLIGRKITVVANGETIICDQVIPGITGGALDSKEAEPGPIYLQGDHGAIEYRNIVLTPGK